MKLLNIKDPLYSVNKLSNQENKELAIGIDLGTTNSVVAVYLDDQVNVIKFNNKPFLPSVVAILNNKVIVGEEAVSLLKTQENSTVFSSIKRLMGKGFKESEIYLNKHGLIADKNITNNEIKLLVKPESDSSFISVTPEIISSYILLNIKKEVEKQLKLPVNKAVITVPAYFNELERLATKNAAKLAGLEVLRLINEPTSAALAYGLDEEITGNYLIYDLGGGTFDVSILQLNKGVFRVISTKGDLYLGGNDFDYLIASELINKVNQSYNVKIETNYIKNLLLDAKSLKEDLTTNDIINLNLNIKNKTYTINFSKQELNNILLSVLNKTINLCKDALKDANLLPKDLSGIILVGGSSKIPLVTTLIKQEFNIEPKCSLNPEQVVAIGASYQAANLSGAIKKSLLLDVTPLSLGIETYGGIVEKIIFRNTPIPVSKTQVFTTFQNNQTSLSLHIIQGERELVKDNHSLAKFTLNGIPPLPAGVPRIEVTFTIDADGLLIVTAKEQITNKVQSIEVKPTFGLSINDIKDIIIDSINNAEKDIEERLLENSKIESLHLINITKNALKEDSNLISTQEINKIEEVIMKLNNEINNNNKDNIKSLKEELILVTNNLAQKRMDKSVKLALEGKNINNLKD